MTEPRAAPRASITRQLTAGLAASLLLATLLLAGVAGALFERALRAHALHMLEEEAQAVLAAVARGPQGLRLDPARLPPTYQRPLSGHYYVLRVGEQQWRARSLWDAELPLPTSPGPVAGLIEGPQGQRLLGLRADYRRHGAELSVVVAADVAPLLGAFRRIGLVLLAVAAGVLLALAVVQRALMRRALAPLAEAEQQLRELQQGRREWLDAGLPRELSPLTGEINRLLQHTRRSLSRSRNALGNLGHALKTPLSVLLSLSERAEPELRHALRAQLEQVQQRIGRELGRARTAGDVLAGSWFCPREELPLLVECLQRAHGRPLAVHWQAVDGALPLERDDMLELLGNLLDNACKWARGRVEIDISQVPGACRLVVEDDGPGIPPAERERVLARGVRLDEQVAGHGLGLGIVGDIVEAYGGRLQLESSRLGGLRVCVQLPTAAALA